MEEIKKQEEAQENQGVSDINAELRDFIVKTANAAQSSHATRLMKAFDQKLNKIMDDFGARFEELSTPKTQQGEGNELDLAKKQYESRITELEKKVAAEQQRAAEVTARNQKNEERARLSDQLRLAGVPEDRLRGAVALLYTEDQRVSRNEAGEIVFKVKRDGYEDMVSLEEGVNGWVSSEEGKFYLPPRQVSGSGNTGGKGPGRKGESKADILAELGVALMGGTR